MHSNLDRAFRHDPTRTKPIVQAFGKQLHSRYVSLAKQTGTALQVGASPLMTLDWLKEAQNSVLLGSYEGQPLDEAVVRSWMNPYLGMTYRQALSRASGHVKLVGGRVTPRWDAQAHLDREHQAGVRTMFARAHVGLANIIGATNAHALRSLQEGGIKVHADEDVQALIDAGISAGRSMGAVARAIADALGMAYERALTLARTETIATHAEATLNAFEEASMYGVTVDAEFATAGDDQVCPRCAELQGETYSLAEARGMIPVHPNCRCAWLPVVGETPGELR